MSGINPGMDQEFVKVVLGASTKAFMDKIRPGEKASFSAIGSGVDYGCLFSYDLRKGPILYRPIDQHNFQEISHHIFNQGFKCIQDQGNRDEITSKIGEAIFEHFSETEEMPTQTEDEILNIKSGLSSLIDYFVRANYMQEGYIHFDAVKDKNIDWKGFDKEKWDREGVGEFLYEMKNPVILQSAQKLFKKHGTAQHYSSRTIQTLLRRIYGIEGREDPNFDPNAFTSDSVVEHWFIKKKT